MKQRNRTHIFRSKAASVFAAACLWALFAAPAQGALLLSINPANGVANAGSTGNFFDVLLTNSGTSSVGIAGFSYGLTVGATDFVFTGATTASPAYIFTGDSFADDFLTGDIRTSADGQTVTASDLTSSGSAVSIGANAVLSLGRVAFSILSGAPTGPITITFDSGPGTSLSDEFGSGVAIDTVTGGTVTVSNAGGAIPEPGTIVLMMLALPAVAFLRKRA